MLCETQQVGNSGHPLGVLILVLMEDALRDWRGLLKQVHH